MKVGLYLDDYKHGRDLSFLSEHALDILKRLASAKKVGIYGLGKLFHDNFFKSNWNEVFCPDLLSDGNPSLWGTEIEGIPVLSPEDLAQTVENKDDLMIITWVSNDEKQVEKLHSLGFCNIINAYDIFDMFD